VEGEARAWLGVELEAAAPDESGVRVGRVVPKSPAEQGGLQAGDLILRLDTEPVAAPPDVVAAVARRRAGARVGLALKRQGAERLLVVTLGAAPERDEIMRMSFVDRPAPAFDGLAVAKGTFTPTIRAQRGQVLVVEFWAPWCVPCRALIPHMNQLHAQFASRGLRIIGITGDPVVRAAAAAAEFGMEYPVASDESGATAKAYGAHAIPVVFVIDRTSTVRDVMVGYDPGHLPKLDALVQRLLAER
jgi:peroxiredoxin